jgi:hypothetical protein
MVIRALKFYLFYLNVERRYWYPEEPPVPSCAEPIILWTMITWLSERGAKPGHLIQ